MIYLDRNYGLGGQVEVRRPGLALVLREIKRRSFMRSKAAGKRLRPKTVCVYSLRPVIRITCIETFMFLTPP